MGPSVPWPSLAKHPLPLCPQGKSQEFSDQWWFCWATSLSVDNVSQTPLVGRGHRLQGPSLSEEVRQAEE